MSNLPTTPTRTAALGQQERKPCSVLELTVDKCTNTYGIAPCTATGAVGSECYNTYSTCQARATYVKGSQTLKFVSRGVMSPLGESLRPYLLNSITAPTNLDFEAGLAARNSVTISLADEVDNDSSSDPYYATRAVPAQGTYWARWLARNKNYFGRAAKLRRGFVADPWDWNLFLDELYIIDSFAVDSNGLVKLVLKDPIKLADNNKIPLPTKGTLQAALKAVETTGIAQAGDTVSIILAVSASAVDGYYVGMEVYIYTATGAGQRRVITAYVGSTREATLSVAWAVVPDATSAYEVSGLLVNVGAGLGAQYADPATSGKPEYIRIGSEIIRYTVKTGDALSWPDATYRAQFGSTKTDHALNSNVQLCRAFVDIPLSEVVTSLLTESGISPAYLSADIVSESAVWYGTVFNITVCLSAPEQASSLVAEILKQIGAVMWWSPQTQKVEFKAIMPGIASYPTWSDDTNLIQGGTIVKNLDNLRITQAAVLYDVIDATASLGEPRNFQLTDVMVDAAAQSDIEYNDVRPLVVKSRWFGAANSVAMQAMVKRAVNRLRDAPKLFTVKIDPKDYTQPIGSMVAIKSFKNVDATGTPKAELCFITQSADMGAYVDVQARSSSFFKRYAFIAPNTAGAYPADSSYAHMADAGGLMGDGSDAYVII